MNRLKIALTLLLLVLPVSGQETKDTMKDWPMPITQLLKTTVTRRRSCKSLFSSSSAPFRAHSTHRFDSVPPG